MKLDLIRQILVGRIGAGNARRFTITNGQPNNKIVIGGKPVSHYAVQQAIEVVKLVHPEALIDSIEAFTYLRKPNED